MTMTDKLKAGQRMMVGFDGLSLDGELKRLIRDMGVGGIILFARNIESRDQVRELCTSAQDFARSSGRPPLFIAIDQEGGQVARLKNPDFETFPQGTPGMTRPEDAVRFAAITARDFLDIGANMDMAPVMDVQPRGFCGVMDKRVFHGDPDFVADMGSRMIREFQHRGIMAVAKHFPGIGRTTLDSHLTLPLLETPFDDLQAHDLIPFQAAIDSKVAGVMISHIQYQALDPDWPASLSEIIIRDLLRTRMGYKGLVMTDDLDMKAIRVPIQTSVQRIVKATVDLALICHKGPDIDDAYQTFLEEIPRTSESQKAHDQSLDRIFALKKQFLATL